VHRRLLTDDGFGLEESLNEEAYGVGLVVRGKHRIHLGNFKQEIDELTFSERVSQSARRWQMEPWMFFASGEKINRRKWQNVRNKRKNIHADQAAGGTRTRTLRNPGECTEHYATTARHGSC
ncbi:hypothetical protein evm_015434, partial [Chilo suppressalis]